MKTIKLFKHFSMAISLLLAASVVIAQDEESEEMMQKAKQAEEMNAKKEMLEQQQQQMKEAARAYSEQYEFLERPERESSRSRGEYYRVRPHVSSGGFNSGAPYMVGLYGQENQSQLTLRKSFREITSTSRGEFDVEAGIRHFRCIINGSVRSGEISIKIEYPDGKTFKKLVINSSADVNFSQSISIKEEEEKKYMGSWDYEIKANEAEGEYMLQIKTN